VLKLEETEYYNKSIFKTTHSSYTGGARKSIHFQLDSGVRCLEFDIHCYNPLLTGFPVVEDFQLGHNKPNEEVSQAEDNPHSISLSDWIDILVNWAKKNPDHAPITLCLDIKENFVKADPDFNLTLLNSRIHNKLNRRLYTHHDLINRNHGSLIGTEWPPVKEIVGKIIVVLTGDHDTKWMYWKTIALKDQSCFIAYSYEDDGEREYSPQMLSEAKFVNCHLDYWAWGKYQFEKGKLLRIWSFNPYYNSTGNFCLPTNYTQQGLICNFPATDTPYEDWYNSAFNYYPY
jgi:hypothetical protein